MRTNLLTNTRIGKSEITNYDKVYLQSLVRRQLLILKEMYTFHDAYPDVIDADIVGSYDALFRIFADVASKELCHDRIR